MGFLLCFCGIAAILSNGALALLSIRSRPGVARLMRIKPFYVRRVRPGDSCLKRRRAFMDCESVSSTNLSKVIYGRVFSARLAVTKQPLHPPDGGFPWRIGGQCFRAVRLGSMADGVGPIVAGMP